MRLYNALSGSLENLNIVNNQVNIYACGPTVYNYIHIGNARPIVTLDLIVRWLNWNNIKINYLQNYTDVDDKIINQSILFNKTESEIANFYINAFLSDIEKLNIIKPNKLVKISEYMNEQIEFIQKIIKNGDGYCVNGNVYFRVKNYLNKNQLWYGELSKKVMEDLIAGERIEINPDKESIYDFVLWKNTKVGITWNSPFGLGRPGWHTECAVLNDLFFNHQTIDLHMGGIDLKFPHHENERIQFISLNKRELAKMWIYNGHVILNKEKMSKSLGNIILVKDFLNNYSSNVLKYLFYSSHYRQPLNITNDSIFFANNEIKKLYNILKKINVTIALGETKLLKNVKQETNFNYINAVLQSIEDDLNTANVLMIVNKLVKTLNAQMSENTLNLNLFEELKIILFNLLGFEFNLIKINQTILSKLKEWEFLKNQKQWEKADLIRLELIEMKVL